MASADMTVTILGPRSVAEAACISIFGEDAQAGPVRRAPATLLQLRENWPGRTDEACDLALNLPIDFDISHDMPADTTKAVVVRMCLVTVIHDGKPIGRALRTNELGFNAISFWEEQWIAHQVAKLRAN